MHVSFFYLFRSSFNRYLNGGTYSSAGRHCIYYTSFCWCGPPSIPENKASLEK